MQRTRRKWGKKCIVRGCNTWQNDGVSLFRIPSIVFNNGPIFEDLTKQRREDWITFISQPNLIIKEWTRVCGKHFVSGKPAKAPRDVDWVPTQLPPINDEPALCPVTGQLINNMPNIETQDGPLDSNKCIQSVNGSPDLHLAEADCADMYNPSAGKEPLSEEHDSNSVILPDSITLTMDQDFDSPSVTEANNGGDVTTNFPGNNENDTSIEEEMFHKLHLANAQVADLKMKLEECELRLDSEKKKTKELEKQLDVIYLFKQLRTDDELTRFYTGIEPCEKLEVIFNCVDEVVPVLNQSSKLDRFSQFCIALIKLRLNLEEEDLAFRFGVCPATISNYIKIWISAMFVALKPTFITWSNLDDVKLSMPLSFREEFPNCISVIEFLKIYLDRPIHSKECASTGSTYKSHETVKYLISITPQGSVSFISSGYSGQVSDKLIVENSGFIGMLQPGDLVLAHRELDIREAVGLVGAEFKIESEGARDHPEREEVDSSGCLSKVHVHIEHVIGTLKRRFRFLSSLSYGFMVVDDNGIPFIDKMVHVACALYNCMPSPIPVS